MRVIAGKYKKQKLFSPNNNDIRPTSDRLKESVFNILLNRYINSYDLENKIFLDLCCGTGSIGIEALSHNCRKCYFLDSSSHSLKIAKQNVLKVKASDKSVFIKKTIPNISNILKNNEKIDIAYIDPPYNSNLIDKTLNQLDLNKWLNNNSIVVVETHKDETFDIIKNFSLEDERQYGLSKIRFLFYLDKKL